MFLCACRYLYHTLRNSKHAVETIDEADVVYVYDYCYAMWLLADHHARSHWWLKQHYEPPAGTGRTLLSVYRQEPPRNATVPEAGSPAQTTYCQVRSLVVVPLSTGIGLGQSPGTRPKEIWKRNCLPMGCSC